MPRQKFELSGVERMLLALYNTVPASARAQIGTHLFKAWIASGATTEVEQRAAFKRFKVGTLGLNVMDDLRGEAEAKGWQR